MHWITLISIKLMLLLLTPFFAETISDAHASNHRMGGGLGGGGESRGGFTSETAAAMGLEATGLDVKFPENISCEGISSEYASPERYDGSSRPSFRMAGLHGGFDISLNIGTPLLAMADGEFVNKGEGGQAEGNFIVVKFSPRATGFNQYIYAKYQHLDELPNEEVGFKFKAGQQIAISGDTGTYGRHFFGGYPHLHVTTFATKHSRIRGGRRFLMRNGRMIDPLAIFLNPKDFSKMLSETTGVSGTIVVPSVVLKDKKILKTKPSRYWPVFCITE